MDIKNFLWEKAKDKKKSALPILSFPAIQKMDATVRELVQSSELQAEAMKIIADNTPTLAVVSFMDLSVEAEAFGSPVTFYDDEIPAVSDNIISDLQDAKALQVPAIGAGRTKVFVDALQQAKALIEDRPVLAGCIGPFTLAGRLFDVNEFLFLCYDEPETVHIVLEKATQFLISYCEAFRLAGANGIIMAEPLAGLLSTEMNQEFSTTYITAIVDAVQREDFALIYHNCGSSVVNSLPEIFATGAVAYHFGNAVDMREILAKAPETMLCMGNIDPAEEFTHGTAQSISEQTTALLQDVDQYTNFIISSGCDIPPHAKWENIAAFFGAVDTYNC